MKQWFTISEILACDCPGLPMTKQGLQKVAKREGWSANGALSRIRDNGAGATEFHYSLLPMVAQMRLTAVDRGVVDTVNDLSSVTAEQNELWQRYDKLTDAQKQVCHERLATLNQALVLYRGGTFTKDLAMRVAATKAGVSYTTVRNWERLTHGLPENDWLAALAPAHKGCTAKADCHPQVWEYIKADYLRAERPSFAACYRRTSNIAKQNGWSPVPAAKTLKRRIEREFDAATIKMARHGRDAVKAMYPALTRTRTHFDAMEAVNIDGHKFDVFVKWEDGSVSRPMMVAIQDLYSNKFVGWRLAKSENKETVQLTIGDMVRNHGIPDKMWLDNGRAFASKWITGGARTRYRFKVRDDDPVGLLTQLNVECHWTTPYSGQSKPIERAFRDMCDDIAKHPLCEGAWTGNTIDNKPENHGSKSVPIDEFRAIVDAGIAEHNARPGRRSKVCGGKLSFDQAFAQGIEKRVLNVRKATPEQARLWLLAVETLKPRKNGEIYFMGNRYWHAELAAYAGQTITIRIDPENLHAPIHAYSQDGRYIVEVPVLEDAGFDSQDAAREHNSLRKAYVRSAVEADRLKSKIDTEEMKRLAGGVAVPVAPVPDETNVERPVFGGLTKNEKPAVAGAGEVVELTIEPTEDEFARGLKMHMRKAVNDPFAVIGSAYSADDAGFETRGDIPPHQDE